MTVGGISHLGVERLVHELADGLAIVVEELLALLHASHDDAGKHGQPGIDAIAAPTLKLCRHLQGPCGFAGLVAVDEQILDAALADVAARGVAIEVYIVLDILVHSLAVHLVDLQPRGFGRGRAVARTEERRTEAVDDPVATWGVPGEASVGVDLVGEHHHIACSRHVAVGA